MRTFRYKSDDEVLELPERSPGDIDNLLHRPSIVREYEGLLDALDDDQTHSDLHTADEEKVTLNGRSMGMGGLGFDVLLAAFQVFCTFDRTYNMSIAAWNIGLITET